MICAHNNVRNFDFILRIWSRPHDKDCLYILSSSKNSFSHILTYRDSTHTHTHTLSLSLSHTFWLTDTALSLSLSHTHILTYRDSTLSLHFWLPGTAWPCQFVRHNSIRVRWVHIHSATFFFPFLPFWLDLFHPRTQPQKFRQTPKETNNQHGRRHVPPRIHCYISVQWYQHTFYSLQDT